MKRVSEQIENILQEEIFGHPSREDELRIQKLENIVMILAHKIDVLDEFGKTILINTKHETQNNQEDITRTRVR